ncbi:MAG: lamin tail domain-containing protein, partial [Dehalococcoidales bacterium]|nr:lamin tail domain-containing protein [Dehalococcoidales bacterium]
VQYASGSENFVVKLNNASFVKFQHITFQATGTSYGHVFQITNGSTNNEISNCRLLTLPNSTSSSFSGIYVSSTINNNNQILNNEFEGGYYGIYWYASSSTARGTGLLVENNTFTDFYYYGVNIAYMNNVSLIGNYIKNGPSSGSIYGARIYYCDTITVTENDIQIAATSTHYGMYLYYNTGSAASPNLIANNVINLTGTGTSTWYGVYFYNQIYSNFYHNSIQLSAGSTSGYALYQSSGNNQNVVNNILVHNGGGYAYYVATTTGVINSNYNNFYSTATPLAYWGAAMADLPALQTANMMDTYSKEYNPVFASVTLGDLTPLSNNIDNMGTPVGVLTDIKGVTRSLTTPDAGAIEFTGISSDIGLSDGSLAAGQCLSTNDSVYIDITNTIGSTIDFSVNPLSIYWHVTGPASSTDTIVVNAGTLAPSTTMTVGGNGVDMSIPGIYTLNAYLGANTVNLFAGNDTLNNMATLQIYVPFEVTPKHVVITNPWDTVEISAKSTFFPGGDFYISEMCHNKVSTGAPVGGWASITYLTAGDYIEITGVPNSDLGGYTLEQWSTVLDGTYTFPAGTFISPTGTAIIAVGQMGSSVPSPANFYYHGNGSNTTDYQSAATVGRILLDPSNNIVDAVGYGNYNFPVAASVPPADWSAPTSASGSGTSGFRLTAPDNNTGSSWSLVDATIIQDPGVVNPGTTVPIPGTLTGFDWSLNGVVTSTNVIDTVVGPWNLSGIYEYVATYVTPCGTLTDTVVIEVFGPVFSTSMDDTICEGDSIILETWIPGGGTTPLIFSEYIEGSSYNKAIELFNPTQDTVDLADFRIAQSVNGGGWAYWHNFPTGAKLAPHDTWVMVHAQVSATYYDTTLANQVIPGSSVVNHNGDDARAIEMTTDGGATWTIIDLIGDPDNDPGTGWPVAGVANATADKTLIRKPQITAGNTDWLAAAGIDTASSEYIIHPQNYFANLGSHTFNPIVPDPVSYYWSTGDTTASIVVAPTVTTTYTVTVTNSVTLMGTMAQIVVMVNPAPAPVNLGADFDVCDDGTATLDAGAGYASYQWSTGATTQTITVSGATIGTGNTVVYSVTVSNTVGCSATDEVSVTAIDCSGIDDPEGENMLTFWPNPNSGNFFVRIKGMTGDASLRISNATGQVIAHEYLTIDGELVKEFNLGNLAPGIYYLRLFTKNNVVTKQIIIK